IFIPSLSLPRHFLSLPLLSVAPELRATLAFYTTARPPQAEPISGKGTVGSVSLSPSKPDRPPPLGRPELIGKPCFRRMFVRVHRFSSSNFSFVSPPNRSSTKVRSTRSRDLRRAVEVRGIHHRAIHSFRASKSGGKFWDWSKYRGDSAEISAEV
ncbi:hypothetical protein Prudu_013078, partial [Prunus dulcis]